MGLIPLVDGFGFSPAPPRLWPMGIGAGRPRLLEANGGGPSHALAWDDAGRLIEVRTSYRGVLATRDRYVWRGDELDRSQHFDEDLGDTFGDAPERERLWRWEGGRPVGVVNEWASGVASFPVEEWEWADDKTVRITESNDVRVINTRTLTFDGDGRLVRIEADGDADGTIDRVVVLVWADGRLQSAREQSGPKLDQVRVVTYRWEGDRLVGQTDDAHPGVDLWVYGYEERA